jgi:hypothetical protein
MLDWIRKRFQKKEPEFLKEEKYYCYGCQIEISSFEKLAYGGYCHKCHDVRYFAQVNAMLKKQIEEIEDEKPKHKPFIFR